MQDHKAALLVPTHRTGREALANISYVAACSGPDLPVYISDNSTSPEKHRFLNELAKNHQNVHVLLNRENIGAFPNFLNLLSASEGAEIIAFITDDDRFSLPYITRGIRDLRQNTDIARSAGRLIRFQANGGIFEDTKDSISDSVSDRFSEFFDPNSFNQIFYSPFRRKDIQCWLSFRAEHPIQGPFFDFLLTLCTLASGKFSRHNEGYYIYFSENWDNPMENQSSRTRAYESLGLPGTFALFHDLHFGIECVNLLLGKHSPISNQATAVACARTAWQRCVGRFASIYVSQRDTYTTLFGSNPRILEISDALSGDKEIPLDHVLTHFVNLVANFSEPISKRYFEYIKANYWTASNLKCNTPPRVRCTDANQYDIPTASA